MLRLEYDNYDANFSTVILFCRKIQDQTIFNGEFACLKERHIKIKSKSNDVMNKKLHWFFYIGIIQISSKEIYR